MSVSVNKTKVEQAFETAFDGVAGDLPGGASVLAARKNAIARFGKLGLPHRRIEEWKYTDLRNAVVDALPVRTGGDVGDISDDEVTAALGPLGSVEGHRIVFIDGRYAPQLSSISGVSGLRVSSLSELLAADSLGALPVGFDDDAVIALNTAYMSDGVVVDIAAGTSLEKPIIVAHVGVGADPVFHAMRNVIKIGDGAKACVVEAFVSLPGRASAGQINTVTTVDIGESATLQHIKCVCENGPVTHLANWIITLAENSVYRGFQYSQGVGLARNQMHVTFAGEGAKLDLSGAFLARGGEHIDNTMVVDHAVPACESRELFKGVLDDRARGVVQGKVIVRPDAQKTDGMQMARVLLLSPNTEFDSKPELEIYADDVVCGHGSTSAELDPDLMFYCMSRAIPEDQARALLIQSFIGEVIETVEVDSVREALSGFADLWLKQRKG